MDLQAFLIGLSVFAILACLLYPREIRSSLEAGLKYLLDDDDNAPNSPSDPDEKEKGENGEEEEEESLAAEHERITEKELLDTPPKSALVMFGSRTCPHCGAASEALRDIAEGRMGKDVFIFELRDASAVAKKFKIKHVPTFIWFGADGSFVQMEGGGYDALHTFLKEHTAADAAELDAATAAPAAAASISPISPPISPMSTPATPPAAPAVPAAPAAPTPAATKAVARGGAPASAASAASASESDEEEDEEIPASTGLGPG